MRLWFLSQYFQLSTLRTRVHERTTFLHTVTKEDRFLLCDLGKGAVAVDGRRGRITSLFPFCVCSVPMLAAHLSGDSNYRV